MKTKRLTIKAAKNSFKALRLSYKIAIIAMVCVVIVNILVFFLVLLPTYAVVGESLDNTVDANKRLDQLASRAKYMETVTYVTIFTATVAGAYGAAKDVTSKSKK